LGLELLAADFSSFGAFFPVFGEGDFLKKENRVLCMAPLAANAHQLDSTLPTTQMPAELIFAAPRPSQP